MKYLCISFLLIGSIAICSGCYCKNTKTCQLSPLPSEGIGNLLLTVVDSNGDPIASIKVKVKDMKSQYEKQFITNECGEVLFENAPSSNVYRISIHDKKYEPFRMNNILICAGATTTMRIAL